MTNYIEYIKANTVRCDASGRGGGIEIDLTDLLKINQENDEGDYLMTAYQNYLGGGMLGSIQNSYAFSVSALSQRRQKQVQAMTDALNRYFHDLTNHEDEWEGTSYERGQLRPQSAY